MNRCFGLLDDNRAFRLNMNQTLEYLSRYGYSINVQGEYLKPSEVGFNRKYGADRTLEE